MTKLFAAENLVTLSMAPCEPWEFKPTEKITLQVRKDKESRQEFYQNTATKHCFYSGLEAHSNTQRVSKENPPRALNAFIADYDISVPMERIWEVIEMMKVKPTYIETSLGGNFRLVWLLEFPIMVESRDFCTYLLQKAHDWLSLGLLPGLDRKAFEETSRLYCNGCEWEATGEGPIPAAVAQAFFVECGKQFRFPAGDDEVVPLDVVEKALLEKYPNFSWPSDFVLESQGPTFWVPDSVSPQSAIVKAGGIFTFAAHSAKPFYSWSDLLGKEFTAKFQADAVAKATMDIYWDAQTFWRKLDGKFVPLAQPELQTYFRVSCRLSAKPDKSGVSPIDAALDHIYNHQRIVGAAPFVFYPPGVIVYKGDRKLNTWRGSVVQPAEGTQKWGPQGDFTFLSALFDGFFNPERQLPHFLAWHKHFYESGLFFLPHPGQVIFFMGGANVGKTLCNREIIGRSVGGFADASDYLVNGSQFNGDLIGVPHWVIDDDAPSSSPGAASRVQALMKKVAANQQFSRNEKFEKACMVPWNGRIGCTTNLDFVSCRLAGPLDNSSLDKVSLFRCHSLSKIKFPTRVEVQRLIGEELPKYLRYLVDYTPPDFVEPCVRYGYKSFQEPSLLSKARQSSSSAPFKEVVVEHLENWFRDNPEAKVWEGTVTTLMRQIMSNMLNETILRNYKMDQASRFLEQIQREGHFRMTSADGARNTRIWTFYRNDTTD